ncbi:hypothetical protein [Enorma burkinafasonensis]|uniref:hypothetical protein n=1 Tax=Enorma burkinafasonensis TaxID=2590867 RepID=UPI0011A4D9A8|nr:hypothetical protein [Enorma burkinafasonensis]
MRLVSRSDLDKEFDPSMQEPSRENEREYQRLLQVLATVEKATRRGIFTSRHTIGVDDKCVLEDRFFGAHPGYMGTEQSIKSVHNDSAPDILIARDNFVLVIDHFCFDCTKWSRKGSPLQALLSNHNAQVKSFSGNELIELLRGRDVRCSEKEHIDNLRQMIKTKLEKANGYFDAIDHYLIEKDRMKQKELWLFAEDVLPIGDIDLVIEEALRQFDVYPKLAGMIYVRDVVPFTISENIDDIRFIYNCNNAQ